MAGSEEGGTSVPRPMSKYGRSWFFRTPAREAVTSLCVVGLAFVVVLGSVVLCIENWRKPTRDLWAQVRIGDPENTVVFLLGQPFREFDRDTAPAEYYVLGYRRRERPIGHRVLIYMGMDLVLYVWINEAGRVEEKFAGGS